jgi:dUTP pyrophosphatase
MDSFFIKRLNESAFVPTRSTQYGTAGLDLYAASEFSIEAGSRESVSTGLLISLQPYTYGRIVILNRLAETHGLTVLDGLINENDITEIKFNIFNSSDENFYVNRGDKIAQLIIQPVFYPMVTIVDVLPEKMSYEIKRKNKEKKKNKKSEKKDDFTNILAEIGSLFTSKKSEDKKDNKVNYKKFENYDDMKDSVSTIGKIFGAKTSEKNDIENEGKKKKSENSEFIYSKEFGMLTSMIKTFSNLDSLNENEIREKVQQLRIEYGHPALTEAELITFKEIFKNLPKNKLSAASQNNTEDTKSQDNLKTTGDEDDLAEFRKNRKNKKVISETRVKNSPDEILVNNIPIIENKTNTPDLMNMFTTLFSKISEGSTDEGFNKIGEIINGITKSASNVKNFTEQEMKQNLQNIVSNLSGSIKTEKKDNPTTEEIKPNQEVNIQKDNPENPD